MEETSGERKCQSLAYFDLINGTASRMAAQYGLDCALQSARWNPKRLPEWYSLYVTDDMLAEQGFTDLHLILLGILHVDLEKALESHQSKINLADNNGRTPLS